MRDTLNPSCRAIENPPAAFAAGVDGDTVGVDGNAAGGAAVTGSDGAGVSTTGMIGFAAGIAVRSSSMAAGGDSVATGSGAGAGIATGAVDAIRPAARSASITSRNGL